MKQLFVKRIEKDDILPLPAYKTPGSVGLDVCARETVVVHSHTWAFVPLNVIVKAVEGTFIALLPRSSTFRKKGLLLANSLGVIDQDYCGEEDEVKACVYNTREHTVVIEKGEELFQLLSVNVETPPVVEVEKMSEVSRGGFGSTDK